MESPFEELIAGSDAQCQIRWKSEQYYRQGELSWLVQGTERRLCAWNIEARGGVRQSWQVPDYVRLFAMVRSLAL